MKNAPDQCEPEEPGQGAKPNQEEPLERRQFIQKAGKAGLSAGLAHFLLVGGQARDAFAQADNCQSPYTDSSDGCTVGNPDVCDPSDYATGDECVGYSGDSDACGPNGSTGDKCNGTSGDTDTCNSTPGTMTMPPSESGDLCSQNVELPDICQVWSGNTYGDDCIVDYDNCKLQGGSDL
jgi:hypothetical protein